MARLLQKDRYKERELQKEKRREILIEKMKGSSFVCVYFFTEKRERKSLFQKVRQKRDINESI